MEDMLIGQDTDEDVVPDRIEWIVGLDPTKQDADGDGTNDLIQFHPHLAF